VDPRDLIIETALDYDPEGLLVEPALARLAWRKARSGKTCERCRERKALAAFARDSRNTDGLRRYCRECAALADRARKARSA
jgi:hypothetical protein